MESQRNKKKARKETKKVNKKVTNKGAEKKSAPNRNNGDFTFDDEIIIGIPQMNYEENNMEEGNRTKSNKKKSNSKKTKQQKNKKKKVKKLSSKQIKRRKVILKLVKWICLLACVIGAGVYIIMSPLFDVRKITVQTDGNLNEQEIISLAAIRLNENIFKFTKSQISNNIKENAYVDKVDIKRKLPDEVQIEIKERTPVMMIMYGNSYVYVNSQGYMLEISSEYKELPILMGIKTEDEFIEAGNRLCNEDLQKLTTVLKIMEFSQNADIFDLVTAIDIADQNDYKVVLDKEEKTIHLGDCSMLEGRLMWAKRILDEETGIPGEIFVNMNLNSENPYFRERV